MIDREAGSDWNGQSPRPGRQAARTGIERIMRRIHPTAIIDPAAELAEDVVIGPYCVIGAGVTIGARTELRNHVTIEGPTFIGADNLFHAFGVIGGEPQDKKFHGEASRLEIGQGNRIREHVTIHRGTENGGGLTKVGDGNLIMVGVHVAHDCVVGNHVVMANQVMLAGHVRIDDRANIGGGTGIHHFATVGTLAMVGGMARVSRDVPPFMLVEGRPARVRQPNLVAMERSGLPEAHIEALKEAHRRLFRENGAPMAEKMAKLREEYGDVPEIEVLCQALEATSRGVHGRAREADRADNKRRPAGA